MTDEVTPKDWEKVKRYWKELRSAPPVDAPLPDHYEEISMEELEKELLELEAMAKFVLERKERESAKCQKTSEEKGKEP